MSKESLRTPLPSVNFCRHRQCHNQVRPGTSTRAASGLFSHRTARSPFLSEYLATLQPESISAVANCVCLTNSSASRSSSTLHCSCCLAGAAYAYVPFGGVPSDGSPSSRLDADLLSLSALPESCASIYALSTVVRACCLRRPVMGRTASRTTGRHAGRSLK